MKWRSSLLLTAIFVLTAETIFLGFGYFSTSSFPTNWKKSPFPTSPIGRGGSRADAKAASQQLSLSESKNAPSTKSTSAKTAVHSAFVKSIFDPEDTSLLRLSCPAPKGTRYDVLRNNTSSPAGITKPKYFFALDLHQCAPLLPRLMGSIIEAMRFLGPENCALSIMEGNSDDGTFQILKMLRPQLEAMGATYFFNTSDIDSSYGERIDKLASLRNEALEPLTNSPNSFDPDPIVIFLNDVAICLEDILELLYQRKYQDADMVCAMDWTYLGDNPTFYDIWIARGMTGETFFEIPKDGSWDFAWDLFWNDQESKAHLLTYQPFQVFSCWNGASVFKAQPLFDAKVRFRSSPAGSCFQGEPTLFAVDFWDAGFGKIAVIPSVNLEYSNEAGERIKKLKGYTSKWVAVDDGAHTDLKIEWEKEPPLLIKCIPNGYDTQTWVHWDDSITP